MKTIIGIAVAAIAGCGYYSEEQGDALKREIADLRTKSSRDSADLRRATDEANAELRKLRGLVDEATKVVTRNSADVGLTVQKLQVDLASLQGKVEDMQQSLSSLGKSFTDYRAASDTKLEQVVNATTAAKNPPIPDNADGVFNEAQKRYDGKQWNDARRLFDAFIARYPTDERGAKAQYLIGEAYLTENKYANAIGAFTKVIDNFPKSEIVPDAMFKNGQAFYALKYCGDARIYFQELLKRYPRTEWKKDANDQLKKLSHDMKDKKLCQS